MKHDFYLDSSGEIDTWKLDSDIHSGPACRRCRSYFCQFCSPECFEEECPSGQQELF